MKASWGKMVLMVLATCLAIPAATLAHNPGFTDSFRLEECTFKTRGRNPYFILEPGYQLILEGEDSKEFVRLEITVLNETVTINGVRTRVV